MSDGCSIRPSRLVVRRKPHRAARRQAWTHFREIEQRGGFVEAREFVGEQIAEVRDRRIDDIAHRRTALTGVNEYPNLAEPPLPPNDLKASVESYAAGFERCGIAQTLTCTAPGRARRCCCCRWARWPSTTSAPPSRRICWRPEASMPSTPALRGCGCRGAVSDAGIAERRGDLRHGRSLRSRGARRDRGCPHGRGHPDLPGRTREGRGRRRYEARRLSDRQDRCGRSSFDSLTRLGA